MNNLDQNHSFNQSEENMPQGYSSVEDFGDTIELPIPESDEEEPLKKIIIEAKNNDREDLIEKIKLWMDKHKDIHGDQFRLEFYKFLGQCIEK